MCIAVIAYTPRPYAGDSGKEKRRFLFISNTMQQIFDAIIDRHRREVAASLKAGAFDDWDVKQVGTMFGYIWHDAPLPMAWGAENFAAVRYDGRIALKFHVQGYKFTGNIIVTYNEGRDYYEVWKEGGDGKGEKVAEDVTFVELVALIDSEVETDDPDSDDYQTKAGNVIANLNGLFNAKP